MESARSRDKDNDVDNNASLIGEDDVADSDSTGVEQSGRLPSVAPVASPASAAATASPPLPPPSPPPTAATAAAATAVANPLERPIYQALYDIGCGCAVSLMVGAKIFTYAILVFQASPAVMELRGNVTNAAAIGVILLTVILMCKSRYPYVVVVPDMFSAPYVITMSFQLVSTIDDPRAAQVTVLAMVFFVYALSAVLHILMASFRLLRFAEFLPYPVFCGLFSAVGLTIVQRAIQFAPGYQIIPTLAVATSLSLKIFKTKETRPALTFVSVSVVATALFYGVAAAQGLSVDDLRRLEWLVASPVKGKQLSNQLVPWLMWVGGDSPVDLSLIQWSTLIRQCGSSVGLLCVLIALRRSMQLANLNRLFACRAKTNYELALHGYSQLLAVVGLGTFSGVLSGPDMVRIKRMHGGEVFPGVASVVALACITLGRFAGVDYIPKFVFMGILANEGIMMLDRFLLMPYRMAGIIEWLAVAAIAVTAFFDIFQGFFLGAAISLVLFSVRFYRIGCVKMTGTGLTIRSTVDRSDAASDWLSSHGEKIRVIQLRGTVAFANVAGVLDVVADMLDMNENKAKPDNSPQGKFRRWFAELRASVRAEWRAVWSKHGGAAALGMDLDMDAGAGAGLSAGPAGTLAGKGTVASPPPPPPPPPLPPSHTADGGQSPAPGRTRLALENMFIPPSEVEVQAGMEEGRGRGPGSAELTRSPAVGTRPPQVASPSPSPSPSPAVAVAPMPAPASIHGRKPSLKRTLPETSLMDRMREPFRVSFSFSAGPGSVDATAPVRAVPSAAAPPPGDNPPEQPTTPHDAWDVFFRPEMLIVDMALVVGVDASALDTFKQIAEHCKRCQVGLYSSGLEPHLDLLEKAGVFPKAHRFADLDAVLSCCEDLLLKRHNVGQDDDGDSYDGDDVDASFADDDGALVGGSSGGTPTRPRSPGDGPGPGRTSIGALVYDPRRGFMKCLDLIHDRHSYGLTEEAMGVLRQLAEHVRPLRLREGDVIMHTTQGSPVDADEDGLFFIESGCVAVQRDPDQVRLAGHPPAAHFQAHQPDPCPTPHGRGQSVALTLRSSRRRRLSVAPRMLRLKHRTFQLSRLGPGWLLGATELCSQYRSLGHFVVQSKVCRAHFLPFRTIKNFERDRPLLALRVYQLASLVLADRYDRSKEQLSHLVDTIYAPPMKVSSATEKALKKARFAFDSGSFGGTDASAPLLGLDVDPTSTIGSSASASSNANNPLIAHHERDVGGAGTGVGRLFRPVSAAVARVRAAIHSSLSRSNYDDRLTDHDEAFL